MEAKENQERQYFSELKALNQKYKEVKQQYNTVMEEAELKKLKSEEQTRAAIAAAVTATKQEMVEYK